MGNKNTSNQFHNIHPLQPQTKSGAHPNIQDLSVVVLLLLLVVVPCCFLVSCCSIGSWGTPTLHGRCCWNSYRPSSHLGEAEGADAQPGGGFVDSFQGVLETCHGFFFRSSKTWETCPKNDKNMCEAIFRQGKNQSRITFDDWKKWKKGVFSLKNNKNGLRFPLCLNHHPTRLHSVELRPLPLAVWKTWVL